MSPEPTRHDPSIVLHPLPRLRLGLPDRRIALVDGAMSLTTIGEIAAAAGLAPARSTGRHVILDGRRFPGEQPLLRCGARHGSRLSVPDSTSDTDEPSPSQVDRGVGPG